MTDLARLMILEDLGLRYQEKIPEVFTCTCSICLDTTALPPRIKHPMGWFAQGHLGIRGKILENYRFDLC